MKNFMISSNFSHKFNTSIVYTDNHKRKEETRMNKKRMLIISFTLAAVLVLGPLAFSVGATEDNGGMGNMMGGNGMSGMMENGNMGKMMGAMNSPEGQEMMNSCSNFMSSYDETEEAEDEDNAIKGKAKEGNDA
jgi:hypothetical protein